MHLKGMGIDTMDMLNKHSTAAPQQDVYCTVHQNIFKYNNIA